MRPLRFLAAVILIVMQSFALAGPALAHDGGDCSHDHAATVEALISHVDHASEMGHITNQGVANALLSSLSAAEAAAERGQPDVAAGIIRAFIRTVEAQSGQHIDPMHAPHLIQHAQQVIIALS